MSIKYIGMDVHQATIVIAVLNGNWEMFCPRES